jgi:DNA primase
VKNEGYSPSTIEKKPKIKLDKKIDMKYVTGLMPHFSFYEKRGISPETLNNFECGVCFSGKQSNRFVFVIRNEEGDVIGVVGRDLIGGRVKWKKLGDSRKWIFPLASLDNAQEEQEVFLVESVGDALALYEISVKNVIVLFGIDLSPKVLNILSTLNLKRIFVSTNNDKEKEKNWGALAAEGIKMKLSKVIDENIIKICLPPNGDWGDMEESQRKQYVKKIRTN